jgi:hypothetical protein
LPQRTNRNQTKFQARHTCRFTSGKREKLNCPGRLGRVDMALTLEFKHLGKNVAFDSPLERRVRRLAETDERKILIRSPKSRPVLKLNDAIYARVAFDS